MQGLIRHRWIPALVLFVAVLVMPGCRKDEVSETNIVSRAVGDYPADVAFEWGELFLDIDRYAPGYRPPAAARMLAYTGLAVYEAAVPGMPEYRSLRFQFPGLSIPSNDPNLEYHWPTVVNAAFATSFRQFYPHIQESLKGKISAMEGRFMDEYSGKVAADVLSRSHAYGKAVAEMVYQYSISDAQGHEAFLNPRPSAYTPPGIGPNGEMLWQPTFPDFTAALFPYWGQVRPFALKPSDKVARPPITWSEDPNSLFYNQAREVQLWVNNASYEDRWIAEFWSDDIFELTFEPAARQIALGNQVIQRERVPLDKAIEFYAKMGMALCDVGIAVWHSKFLYNVERPVQYIRRVIDPEWRTILNNPLNNVKGMTPEFPAYPSGHSGFGGAGSAVLAEVFGNIQGFTDKCHQNRTEFIGTPRSYNNFMELGVENAYSRLPLGVHFRMDCDEGLRLGYLAARRVSEMPWRR